MYVSRGLIPIVFICIFERQCYSQHLKTKPGVCTVLYSWYYFLYKFYILLLYYIFVNNFFLVLFTDDFIKL